MSGPPFCVLVCGSRSIKNYSAMRQVFHTTGFPWNDTQMIVGDARGIDQMAYLWANLHCPHPPLAFTADWGVGHGAGFARNRRMLDYLLAQPEDRRGAVAVWDGRSPGTHHMISLCVENEVKTFVSIPPDPGGFQSKPRWNNENLRSRA